MGSRLQWRNRCSIRTGRRLPRPRYAAIVAALAWAPAMRAQTATGRLEGEVRDSVRSRAAAGSVVFATRMRPEPALYFSAAADDRGRYRIDSLPAGEYLISFSTGLLDSLEVALPGQRLVLADGEHARVDLGAPSSATIKRGACPGLVLPTGKGAVVGHVHRAETDRAMAGAIVAVSWRDLTVDRATLRAATTERTAAARTDSAGLYRMCGLPTDVSLLMQVQHEGRAASVVRVLIPDDVGVLLQHFSFSESGSRPIAALDSAGAAERPVALGGRAALAGVVRTQAGQPVADAQVRIVDAAAPAARTDSLGRFELSGLPSGTQLLDVRRIGYLLVEAPVELRDGATVTRSVVLTRIVSLDSVRVLAQRTRYREFESHRGANGFGRFLRDSDLTKINALETSDFLRGAGFFVQGGGLDAKVVSLRSMASSFRGPCAANVVIDGMQHQDINLVPPADVGAIEIYRGSAGAPIEYDSACGVIVIWTKR